MCGEDGRHRERGRERRRRTGEETEKAKTTPNGGGRKGGKDGEETRTWRAPKTPLRTGSIFMS